MPNSFFFVLRHIALTMVYYIFGKIGRFCFPAEAKRRFQANPLVPLPPMQACYKAGSFSHLFRLSHTATMVANNMVLLGGFRRMPFAIELQVHAGLFRAFEG